MPPAARSLRRPPAWVALALLVVLSTALRSWAALGVTVPWIAPDEMIYGLVGQSLYRSGSLDILGGPTPYYSFFVPAFAGLPLSLGDLAFGYSLLKVLQALAMSLTAVPVYLWGRSLVAPRWAFAAAVLTVALPGLVYSGLVMSEVLFYPVFVLAAWAAARAVERPTLARQLLLAAAVTLAVLTRLQALVLLPAVVTAIGLDALFARSTRKLRRFVPTFALVVVAAAAWGATQLTAGGTGLGGYGVVAQTSYDAGRALRFVLYHAADVVVLTGVFPACALLLLLVGGLRRDGLPPPLRAFLAVAASLVLWIVVEVGVFASRYVGQLAERDLICLAPVLFLGFAVWLDRGGPRGYWPMTAVGLIVAGVVVALPLGRLVTSYAPPDAPTLTALYDLRSSVSLRALEIAFFAGVAGAIVAFALVPRRALAVLPALLVAALAAASVAAATHARQQSDALRSGLLGPDRRWIDHAADGPAAYLADPGTGWVRAWETLFWNRRVDAVYALGPKVFGPVPQQRVRVRRDGRFVARSGSALRDPPRYVVAPLGQVESVPAYAFAGTLVAYVRQPDSTTGGTALWRIDPPLRLASRASGLQPNGDIWPSGDGRLVAYGCGTDVFHVTLLVKQPQTVTILRNGRVYHRARFTEPGPNQPWHLEIPTVRRRGQGSCTLDVRPTGLLGTTVFRAGP